MTSEQTSKLGNLLLLSIIILACQIVIVILHGIVGNYTLSYIIDHSSMIVWTAILVATAIIGPRVIEKQPIVRLIIGIGIAALSALLIIYSLLKIFDQIDALISYHLSSLQIGVHIVTLALQGVSIALCIIILIRGIRLIIDYSRQSS